jgi:hypothetical protein
VIDESSAGWINDSPVSVIVTDGDIDSADRSTCAYLNDSSPINTSSPGSSASRWIGRPLSRVVGSGANVWR